jgi:cytochrome bd ubiquinol oxidase subunit II
MVELWFALLCVVLTIFAVLDGWNIGVGALHLTVARTTAERREVITALGPLWSWHEVWLVAGGGVFLLAFPGVMAASFSGFYLALWLVLWALILRGIAIEVGGHLPDPLWRSAWDFVFAVSSVLLAVLFGAALGNVIRGVPLDATGQFSLSLFTHFGVRGRVGVLDWYTLSVAVFTTVLLAAHGATYLRLETTGPLRDRSTRLARQLWTVVPALFLVISVETWFVRPDFHRALIQRPIAWLAVIAVAAGAWLVWTGLRGGAARRALSGSCLVVSGLLAGAAAGLFPVMLHSTLGAEHSLTAYGGATARRGLVTALIWWPAAFVLAIAYAVVILRHYRGGSAGQNTRSLPE